MKWLEILREQSMSLRQIKLNVSYKDTEQRFHNDEFFITVKSIPQLDQKDVYTLPESLLTGVSETIREALTEFKSYHKLLGMSLSFYKKLKEEYALRMEINNRYLQPGFHLKLSGLIAVFTHFWSKYEHFKIFSDIGYLNDVYMHNLYAVIDDNRQEFLAPVLPDLARDLVNAYKPFGMLSATQIFLEPTIAIMFFNENDPVVTFYRPYDTTVYIGVPFVKNNRISVVTKENDLYRILESEVIKIKAPLVSYEDIYNYLSNQLVQRG